MWHACGMYVCVLFFVSVQVHAIISCLQTFKEISKSPSPPPPPAPPEGVDPPPLTPGGAPTDTEGGASSMGVSMYHSAVGSYLGSNGDLTAPALAPDTTSASLDADGRGPGPGGRGKRPPDAAAGAGPARRSLPDLAQQLLVASEKQISAKFSIAEILLSLSSRGRPELDHPLLCLACMFACSVVSFVCLLVWSFVCLCVCLSACLYC